MDAGVIIVGAGPTGLMLAGEVYLAGVRPLVLEPQPPRHPFGGVHLDFTPKANSPLQAPQLPQPRLERLLDERARELGADLRRGHEVVEANQDDDIVTMDVRGPDGPYRVTAQYLVGCDGAHSRVCDMAASRSRAPHIQRPTGSARSPCPDSVTRLGNGDLHIPGLGRTRSGFTRTDRGVLAVGSLTPEVLLVFTTEDEPTESDNDAPMTLTELPGQHPPRARRASTLWENRRHRHPHRRTITDQPTPS